MQLNSLKNIFATSRVKIIPITPSSWNKSIFLFGLGQEKKETPVTKCRVQTLSVEFSNISFENQVTYQIYVEQKEKL